MNKQVRMEDAVSGNFSRYAGGVILDRAICDVRDMVKPSARMLMYSQYKTKNTNDKPFVKSARVVGDCLGHFYQHGDQACYGTYMRMAKPFAMRYPLEDCQGNYGTLITTGDEAASRYTELRLSKITKYMFNGLEKKTVDKWRNNFDDTEQFPSVLPTVGYYNICNGSIGLGIALSSSIPQFNVKDVNEALIKLVENPDADYDDIFCMPDFATGGFLMNPDEVKEILKVGHGGSCKLRAKITYDPQANELHVTELPYGVYTSTIDEQLKEITEENPNYGIASVNDASGKVADYIIKLHKGVNPKAMIKKLYHDTSLEYHYTINMTMLDQGRYPKVFGWKEALCSYLEHAKDCKRKEYQFDLNKALARKNIVDGLIICIAHIDEIVKIIRSASSTIEASKKLTENFGFNEAQTKAILDLKLQRLVNLEAVKVQKEHDDLVATIDYINNILSDEILFNKKLIDIFKEVANTFGDPRRTVVVRQQDTQKVDAVEENVSVVVLSNNTIRILDNDSLVGARRGRKGTSLKLPKGVEVIDTLYTTNQSKISVITKKGKIHFFDISNLDLGQEYSLYELISIDDDDIISKVIDATQFDYHKYIIFVTRNGMIKKSLTSEYNIHKAKGVAALKLRDGDCVVNCFLSSNEDDRVCIVTEKGRCVKYTHDTISCTGRVSLGVKAISLTEGDCIVGADMIYGALEYLGILTINNTGKGRIMEINDLPADSSRTSKGFIAQKLNDNETISTVKIIKKDCKKIKALTNNKVTSMSITEVPVQGRNTAGVQLIDARGLDTDIYVIAE